MATGKRTHKKMDGQLLELARGDCFHVEVDGVSCAGFTRCSGLDAEVEVVAYREGGCDGVRLFRDRRLEGRIVLERGVAHDRSLWEWFRAGDARSGAVLLLDGSGRELLRWVFASAWPSRWVGPRLEAGTARVAVELVEIVHEGVEWRAP
jgi:phage tail-like protein